MSGSPPTKRCSQCGEIKPLDAFYKNKRSKDGHKAPCKACEAAYQAARFKANPDKVREEKLRHYHANREQYRDYRTANADHRREQQRQYRVDNADKIREQKHRYYVANKSTLRTKGRLYYRANKTSLQEYHRQYHRKHADRISERGRHYYAANKSTLRAKGRLYYYANKTSLLEQQHRYHEANKGRIRERGRLYAKTHPEVYRAARQRRRALLKGNGGNVTARELATKRASQNGFCAYCQMPHDPQHLTIDHVIPLRQGGPHIIANIVFACGVCNASKGNRTPAQWTDRWYERK